MEGEEEQHLVEVVAALVLQQWATSTVLFKRVGRGIYKECAMNELRRDYFTVDCSRRRDKKAQNYLQTHIIITIIY